MGVTTFATGLAWVLGGAVCTVESGSPSAPPATVADVIPPRASEADDPTLAELERLAVYDDDFARTELYTWTTVEQLRRVRETQQLLVADAATGGRASPFNRALHAIAGPHTEAGRIASLLLERDDLDKRRYAWPSPFATVMGLGPRRYGDSLIRIELDARAWIGRFEPRASAPLSFADIHGEAVALADVLAAPERIAALFHVRGQPRDPIEYREYVVCNEAMIAAWSLATPEIEARVTADIALLESLRTGGLAHLPRTAALSPAAPDWHTANRAPTELTLWHASLAFDNLRYQPLADHLLAIEQTLRGYEHDGGPPLQVRPSTHTRAP